MKRFKTRAMTGCLAFILTFVVLLPSALSFDPQPEPPGKIQKPLDLPPLLQSFDPQPEPPGKIREPLNLPPLTALDLQQEPPMTNYSASASQDAGILISPGDHQWIKQGEKLLFTAHWWSADSDTKIIHWMMDGVKIGGHAVQGKAGTVYLLLHASDYPVKTSSGDISPYKFYCVLFSGPTSPAGFSRLAWDETMVYICPPSEKTELESSLEMAPTITSLSWQKTADYLRFELACTPVDGATGYEVFAKAGLGGEFKNATEDISNNLDAFFHLPTEEITYSFKARAWTRIYLAEEGGYADLNGPFGSEVSVTVPGPGGLTWETFAPFLSFGPIPLITPTPPPYVTSFPQLKTTAPLLPKVTLKPKP